MKLTLYVTATDLPLLLAMLALQWARPWSYTNPSDVLLTSRGTVRYGILSPTVR